MWRGIQSFRGWGKFGTVLTREADAARRLPARHFTSVAGSSRARSSSYREHFVNAAEPAWNVPCPWHGHSCRGSQRQRDATSLRIRDVPQPCCVRLSWCFLIASRKNVGYRAHGASSQHPQPGNGGGTKKRGGATKKSREGLHHAFAAMEPFG